MAPSEKVIALETEILQYIPQRIPMVMVGKLCSVEGKTTTTSLLINEDNIFCEDGFFKEPGLIENMAQTAAAGAGYVARAEGKEPAIGFIGGIRNLRILDFPPVGSTIITKVTVTHEVFDASVVTGQIFLNDILVAECELKIFLANTK
jgi:predicted hotdog family 3-hydroxylacyl-ACP dehydratase